MDPQISAVLAGLLPMLEGMVALGVPGLLLGMAAIPAIVIALVCWLYYKHDKQLQKVLDAYRTDTRLVIDTLSKHHDECIRVFSEKHDEATMEFAAKHQEVVNFYTNNVTLVKSHEKLAEANQTLVVNNTRALEHLCVVVESLAKNRA